MFQFRFPGFLVRRMYYACVVETLNDRRRTPLICHFAEFLHVAIYIYIYMKLRVLSPRANYTDRATAALSAKLVLTFADRGLSHSQRGRSPVAVISVFYTGAAIFFFQIAPQLYSRG
jgi:hypothetical protein